MSKLKVVSSTFFAAASLTGVFLFCKTSPEIAFANSKHVHQESMKDAWGKPNAPVSVKIQELSKSENVVELRGLIRSTLSDLKIEWKLPDGAVLVSGELNKNATKRADGSFTEDIIKVDISNAKDEPIVFVAFSEKNGERIGNSRVYKWNISEEQKEHVEKIKMKMKSRNSKFVP